MKTLASLLLALFALLPATAAAQESAALGWEAPKTWVFAVGILEWTDPSFAPFPKKDRRDAKLVALFEKRGVPKNQIVFLKDTDATLAKARASFTALLAKTRPGDLLIFYFAGHGERLESGEAVFVPYDAKAKALATTGWKVGDLFTEIEAGFKGSRALLTADCCYSGALAKQAPLRAKRVAYAALTSSLASAPSTGNWTFTEGLLAGLRGRPWVDANGDGAVDLSEVAAHVRKDMSFAEGQLSSFATTKGFAATTRLSIAGKRAGKRLGERLEAKEQDKWWRARVVATKGDQVKIHYLGWAHSYDEWLPGNSDRLRPYRPKTYKVGAWVRAEWKKVWYAARVLEVVDGMHRIHYNGFEAVWDEWVAPERLKPLARQVGAKIKVQYMKDKSWYSAKIVSIKGDKVAVDYDDYDDYDDSWNETVGWERIQLP